MVTAKSKPSNVSTELYQCNINTNSQSLLPRVIRHRDKLNDNDLRFHNDTKKAMFGIRCIDIRKNLSWKYSNLLIEERRDEYMQSPNTAKECRGHVAKVAKSSHLQHMNI